MAIRVELELIDGSFVTRMLHAGESIDRFNASIARTHPQVAATARNGQLMFNSFSRADGATKGLLGTLRDFSIVAGALTLAIGKLQQVTINYVGQIVQVNAEFERMTRLLAGMSTAADPMADAAAQMAQFRQLAKEVPFAMETIMAGAVKLKAVGIQPLDGTLQSVTDAVAAFGGSGESFTRAILAMTQMSGKGVIQMEELRQQLAEAVPRATELMARSMGVSYGKLMELIATGTVESAHALKSMTLEFERTFGGSAIRMMSTYAGQVELLKTNLQNLALNVGGDQADPNSFFGELKKQIQDLNFLLEGPAAQEFAKNLGEALKTTIQYIRQGIEFIVKFKDEIKNLGIALGIAFGSTLAIRGIGSIVGALGGLGMRTAEVRARWRLFGQALEASSAAWSAIPARAGMGARALGAFGVAVAGVRGLVASLAVSLSAMAGVIPLIGMAIWGLAEYFDWFGKSTAEALAELDKLEEKSSKLETERKLNPLLTQKKAELEAFKNIAASDIERQGAADTTVLAEIESLEAEITLLEKKIGQAVEQANQEDLRRAVSNIRARLAEEAAAINTAYDLRSKAIQDEADAELKAGKTATEVDKKRKAGLTESNIQYYDDRIKLLNAYVVKEQTIIEATTDKTLKSVAEARRGVIIAELNEQRLAKDQFQKTGMFVNLVDGGDDIAEGAKRGTTALNNLKEEAAGLRSELLGGSNAMGELQAKIANGDFGDIRDEGVRKFTEGLIEAQEEVDNLKDALEFLTDSQNLYDKTLGDMQDKLFDLQTEGMTPPQKYLAEQQRIAANVSPGGRMALMMLDLKGKVDQTNTSLGGLISGFVEGLFGTGTANQGRTVVGILDQMLQRVQGITGAISGLQFTASGGAGMSFTGIKMSGPSIEQAVKNGILSLIGAAEGTDKGRGYNETLGYGAFTGGPVDLVNMTLREVLKLQSKMLANPANNFNSSAVGRYQITSETLRDFMGQMNLSPDMKFTPELQDAIARAIIESTGGDVGKMRGRWEGLERVDDASINTAMGFGSAGATALPNTVRDTNGQIIDQATQLRNLSDIWAQLGAAMQNAEMKKYADQLAEITLKSKGASEAEIEFRNRVKAGEFGPDTNPDSERYVDIIAKLREATAAEEKFQDVKSKRKEIDKALEANTRDLLEAERDLKTEQTKNVNPYSEQMAGLEALKQKYDELIDKAKEIYGIDSDQYKQLMAQKGQALELQQQRDFTTTMSILQEKRAAEEDANLTDVQRSANTIDQKIADLRTYLANFRGTEAERSAIAEQVNGAIAALEQQRLQSSSNAFTQQMKQWSDISNNMAQYMAGVANTVADGMTQMIMGERVDWQDMLKSMVSDFVNMGLKYFMSSMMGGKGQMMGQMGAMGGKGMMGGKGKGMMGAGVMHTGGIVGRLSAGRTVSPLTFAGAPRFHSGGLIKGLGIGPDEVPIIARRGEGVFTPEQMRAMGEGGGSRNSVVTNVTVNSNGGDQKQNDDLAKKVAREVESSVRGIVFKEMRAQMRPGNMMNR